MSRHVLFDRCLVAVVNAFGKPFFRESIESPPFEDHLAGTRIELPPITGRGYYESSVATLVGTMELTIHVMHVADEPAPLLVYNMGGGESPFDGSARKIFPLDETFALNVVAVEAPLQRSRKQLSQAFARLDNYLAMIAASVKMNEYIVGSPRFRDASVRVVTGISLGGFVAGRHHLAFDTADAYVPFVAGTRHGDIFLSTIRSGALVHANPEHIRSRLNFDVAWRGRAHPNVFPILARYDQLNRLELQAPSYGDTPVEVWDGGHLFNVFHPDLTRRKLLDVVAAAASNPAAALRRAPAADDGSCA